MTQTYLIRLATQEDYRQTEEITREAFWNHFQPGADEHYLLHKLRQDPDFIAELDFLIEYEDKIVGSIAYSRASIVADETGMGLSNIATFGPVSIHPSYQGLGLGRLLIENSIKVAKEFGYAALIIYGDPRLYHRFGFRCCEKWDIASSKGKYAVSLMALPLIDNCFQAIGTNLRFHESGVFEDISPEEVKSYDATFPEKVKGPSKMQDDFKILISLVY
jgi:putative acetyltransferase